MTIHVKSFNNFLVESTLDEVEKEIKKWNDQYSKVFKFKNDKAKVVTDIQDEYINDAKVALTQLAKLLKANHKVSIIIEAHTSSPQAGINWDKSNKKLSQSRANNMLKYLTSLGVNEKQLSASGLAFDKPIKGAEDDTLDSKDGLSAEQKQSKNRRATIRIDYDKINADIEPVEDIEPDEIEIDDTIITKFESTGYELRTNFNSYTIQLAERGFDATTSNLMKKINKFSIITPNCPIGDAIKARKAQIEKAETQLKTTKKEKDIKTLNHGISNYKHTVKRLEKSYADSAKIGIEINAIREINQKINQLKNVIINEDLPVEGSQLETDIKTAIKLIKKNNGTAVLIGQSNVSNPVYRKELALARAYYIKLVILHYEPSLKSNMIIVRADRNKSALAIILKAS